MAYPILVYFYRDQVPLYLFVSGACVLLLARAYLSPGSTAALFRLPLLLGAVAIAVLGLVDAGIASKAYPATLSALFAIVFGNSLRQKESLVERFARLQEPQLPPAGRRYCRQVTAVWTVWLSLNALIAALLALLASTGLWALWTGVISYLIMGTLFLGEMVLRRFFADETLS